MTKFRAHIWQTINPLRANFFRWSRNLHLPFMSFIHFDLTQVVEILPHVRQGPTSLHWRHNEYVGVSNHQPQGCLLNRLLRRGSKKTSKLRVTGVWIPRTNGQLRGKCFHLMTSSSRATYSISWVLMSWRRKEPGHQQPWYLLCWTVSIRSPHVKD